MEIFITNDQVHEFICSLENQTHVKVLRIFDLLRIYGHELRMPYMKMIDRGVYELRICGKQNIRFVFVFRDTRAIILHGFVKKSMRIPWKELNIVKKRILLFDKQ